MTRDAAIAKIEDTLGARLPSDYRRFLLDNHESMLEPSRQFPIDGAPAFGSTGLVDLLHTADEIVDSECLGDHEEKMLIIGADLFGGYVYLCYAPERFGRVFFRKPFEDATFYQAGTSFEDFWSKTRPVSDDD